MVISKLQLFLGFPPGLVIEYINKKRHVDYHFPHVFKIFLLIIGFEYNWFSLQTYSLLCTFKNSFEKGVVPVPPPGSPQDPRHEKNGAPARRWEAGHLWHKCLTLGTQNLTSFLYNITETCPLKGHGKP